MVAGVTLWDTTGEQEWRSAGLRPPGGRRWGSRTLGSGALLGAFKLLLLGWRRGDGGRCFPCSALSSWPMFQPPGSAPPVEPLSSAVVVEQLEVAASVPQRQEMPHHKHQEVEPEHVYDCLLLLLLLRHLGPERTLEKKKKKAPVSSDVNTSLCYLAREEFASIWEKLVVVMMADNKTAAVCSQSEMFSLEAAALMLFIFL